MDNVDKKIEDVEAAFPEISLDDSLTSGTPAVASSSFQQGTTDHSFDPLSGATGFDDFQSGFVSGSAANGVEAISNDLGSFEAHFPPAEDTISFTNSQPASSARVPEPVFTPVHHIPEESEAIKKWKVEFQSRIDDIDKREKELHKQALKKAKEDLERFYAEYEEKKARSTDISKDSSATRELGISKSGSPWEKVSKYIDLQTAASIASVQSPSNGVNLNGPIPRNKDGVAAQVHKNNASRDAARMKAIIHDLKSDPNAPVPSLK